MENKSVIKERGYEFALRIFKLCKFLEQNKTARVLISQLLKSGTSIGANVEEALGGQSRKDFIAKISIAYKEARETNYWLRILRDTETVSVEKIAGIIDESDQILKILSSILITSKQNINKS